ncbi:TPM domain-containing protein [Flavobacterium aciduliphilum]|uniref:TLP18.3/Psb32/MOLO-1 phosphatase superfamily protein n=1 Tax=Flavobacterium aciduliphilum TaxID=1101402 RepID=A0A328YJG2_9FLAO|nr:TPM domain-containing protein [Flavobacterium aciduliphilum]RAR74191.1 TLP18.3/Psb32/MOLO-1 phosphatase superfamily protein [Flavobacterium aciduliphilum]
MSKVEDFLSKKEEAEVVEAIRMAEENTSGEIRVHVEKETSIATIDRAMEVFSMLKMENTKDRNGVLIYVAVKSKQFAIYGDQGINNKVGDDFWNTTKDIMLNHFKNGNNKQALVEGILSAGQQLKHHFPYQNDDVNELSNEISKG